MASLMLQYDRPTDHTRNWHDYNGRVRDWITRLLQTPGAVSFMAYRTVDGASPNTIGITYVGVPPLRNDQIMQIAPTAPKAPPMIEFVMPPELNPLSWPCDPREIAGTSPPTRK